MRLNQTLCIAGIRIISLNTLRFVRPLSQDLSHLRSALHMRWYLMLWTTSVVLYFCVYARKQMAFLEYRSRLGWLVLSLGCLGMISSVLLPYAPYVHTTLSKWHTRLTMGSTILYVLLTSHILCELLTRDMAAFRKVAGPCAMLAVFELLPHLLNGSISTLLGMRFPMTVSLYLYTVSGLFSRRDRFSK